MDRIVGLGGERYQEAQRLTGIVQSLHRSPCKVEFHMSESEVIFNVISAICASDEGYERTLWHKGLALISTLVGTEEKRERIKEVCLHLLVCTCCRNPSGPDPSEASQPLEVFLLANDLFTDLH